METNLGPLHPACIPSASNEATLCTGVDDGSRA